MLDFDRSARLYLRIFLRHLGIAITVRTQITYYTKTGFNNELDVKTFRPLPDLKLNLTWNRKIGDKVVDLTFGYSNAKQDQFRICRILCPQIRNINSEADVLLFEKNYIEKINLQTRCKSRDE